MLTLSSAMEGVVLDQNFITAWSLSFSELEFVHGYRHATRIGIAVQLLQFRHHGYFTTSLDEVSSDAVEYVADQVGECVGSSPIYDSGSDTSRRHRLEILRFLGIRRATDRDRKAIRTELKLQAARPGLSSESLILHGYKWALHRAVFVPSRKIMERLVRSALHAFQEDFLMSVFNRLEPIAIEKLGGSLAEPRGTLGFQQLKGDVGAATLDNVLDAAGRLEFIRSLDLPFDLLKDIDTSWVRILMRRVEGETASEMRRHSKERRLGLFAVYLMSRRALMIDGLVDLLIEVVHRIGSRSRRKVVGRIARDIEKVHGKERLLVEIATAAMLKPNGRVVDVIYPIVGAAKLKAIIDEHHAKGTLDKQILTVMRGSYASHYRRELCPKVGDGCHQAAI